jgi:hypothetical protein
LYVTAPTPPPPATANPPNAFNMIFSYKPSPGLMYKSAVPELVIAVK